MALGANPEEGPCVDTLARALWDILEDVVSHVDKIIVQAAAYAWGEHTAPADWFPKFRTLVQAGHSDCVANMAEKMAARITDRPTKDIMRTVAMSPQLALSVSWTTPFQAFAAAMLDAPDAYLLALKGRPVVWIINGLANRAHRAALDAWDDPGRAEPTFEAIERALMPMSASYAALCLRMQDKAWTEPLARLIARLLGPREREALGRHQHSKNPDLSVYTCPEEHRLVSRALLAVELFLYNHEHRPMDQFLCEIISAFANQHKTSPELSAIEVVHALIDVFPKHSEPCKALIRALP